MMLATSSDTIQEEWHIVNPSIMLATCFGTTKGDWSAIKTSLDTTEKEWNAVQTSTLLVTERATWLQRAKKSVTILKEIWIWKQAAFFRYLSRDPRNSLSFITNVF